MKHRIKSTRYGSDRFGACEICKQHATEIFILTRLRPFRFEHDGTTYAGEAHEGNVFGCRDCLDRFAARDAQQNPETATP